MSTKENAETKAIYMQKKNAKKTPRFFMYDLHSRRRQFSCCHFLISFLKASNDVSFLHSLGTIFHILVPRDEILSVPQ